jgi:protein-S-isoprenylcysteine O-methyltransferase Ste14
MSAAANDARDVPLAPTRWLPPRFFALALALGVAAHFVLGGPRWLRAPWIGAATFAVGLALALSGSRTFAHVGAAIKPTERSTLLVTEGPFRFSRNPMYLGMILALTGVALVLGTPAAWLAVLGMALLLRFRFIANEERALAVSLGEPYLAYQRRVRRWL